MSSDVWHFAYGSNLHPDKRKARADLSPLEEAPGVLRDWRLAFNIPLMPWLDPSVANVVRAPGRDVHGLLMRLEPEQYAAMVRSEGGGEMYSEECVTIETYDGRTIEALTFVALPARTSDRDIPPSYRYWKLIVDGARLSELKPEYIARIERLPHQSYSRIRKEMTETLVTGLFFIQKQNLPYVDTIGVRFLEAFRWFERTLPPGPRHLGSAAVMGLGLGIGTTVRAGMSAYNFLRMKN